MLPPRHPITPTATSLISLRARGSYCGSSSRLARPAAGCDARARCRAAGLRPVAIGRSAPCSSNTSCKKVPAVADTSAARIRTYCAPKQLLRRLQGILPVQVEVLAVPRTHLLDATRCKEQSIVDKCTFVDGVKLECLLVKPGNMRIVVKWDLLVSQP